LKRRVLPILLAVSVLLNLFMLGALTGGAVWLKARQPMIAAGSLRIAGAELPRPERREFRTALRETRRSMRQTRFAGHQARLQAAALLRQPDLDQQQLNAALERARQADFAMRAAVETRAVSFAAGLPQADRERLADAMVRRADHHRRGR
jgi:uncharacterized membrane protein